MNVENAFIYFTNGANAKYNIEPRAALLNFKDDFLAYLAVDSSSRPRPKEYEVSQGDKRMFLVIDFSKVYSIEILDDGGRPA